MNLQCQKCGGDVSFTDLVCATCGAPIGKSGDRVPFLHFGMDGATEVENVKIKDLGSGRINIDGKVYEPVPISSLPSMETTSKWRDLSEKGEALAREEKYEEALKCYDDALDCLPNAWLTLLTKAGILLELKRYEEVITIAENLLTRQVAVLEALHIRGIAKIYLDRPEEGLQSFNSALKLKPNYAPILKSRDHLFATHPNNVEYTMNIIREPVRKTYTMLYDLLSKVEASEHITFRILDITMEGFVNSAIKNEFDMEFTQPEFQKTLPVVLYKMLLNIGYFIIYVGELKSPNKRLLLCGTMHDLTPREYMTASKTSEDGIEQYPYHELMWDNFENYQKRWKDIWEGGMAFPLMLFYNHKILIEYLESLKNSYTK